MTKKILLIHPRVEKIENFTPHLGLALLAGKLKEAGHKVLVIDYAIGSNYPEVKTFLKKFKPDIVGVSLYTAAFNLGDKTITTVKEYNKKIPVLVGGPHATIYYNTLLNDQRIDYIFRGEAENHVVEIVNKAKVQKKPILIDCPPQDISNAPIPNFTCFYKSQDIATYPLQTSRGCPFNCSFCTVRQISSRHWRWRKPEDCIAEIKIAKKSLPDIEMIRIIDDNPGVNRARLKDFLQLFVESNLNIKLEITNLRADHIDEDMVKYIKQAGISQLVIGVESGNPEVFEKVDKGETLDDIRNAAKLIKGAGIFLRCCFIIGLPYDSLEKFKVTIKFAKEIKADFFHWNAFTPFIGTRARDWYEANGTVYNEINHTSLQGTTDFYESSPAVETPQFSIFDQKKAYALAMLETNNYIFKLKSLPLLLKTAVKYNLYFTVAKSLITQPAVWFKHLARLYKCGLLTQNIKSF